MANALNRMQSPVPTRRKLDPISSPPHKRRELFDSLEGSTLAPKKNDEFSIPTCSTACPDSGAWPSPSASWTDDAAVAKPSFQFKPATKDAYDDIRSLAPDAAPWALDAFFSEPVAKVETLQPATPAPPLCANQCLTVAPPVAPCPGRPGALMHALSENCCDTVQDILRADPDAATEPFWDHDVEPPVCAAIRLKCKPEIVALLLKTGADVHSSDVHCKTPMDLLCSEKPTGEWWERWSPSDWDTIKQMLIDAGAVPWTTGFVESSALNHEPEGVEAIAWIANLLDQDAALPFGESESSMADWFMELPNPSAQHVDLSHLFHGGVAYPK